MTNENFFNYCQRQLCSTHEELAPGQILAPMLVESNEVVHDFGLKTETLKTHSKMGKTYLVAFVPVARDEYELMEKEYNRAVNNYLSDYRKPRSKYAPKVMMSYEDWVTGADFTDKGDTTVMDEYLLEEMLKNLLQLLREQDEDLATLLIALLNNEGEWSRDKVIKQSGLARSTGYNKLKKLRQYVSDNL